MRSDGASFPGKIDAPSRIPFPRSPPLPLPAIGADERHWRVPAAPSHHTER